MLHHLHNCQGTKNKKNCLCIKFNRHCLFDASFKFMIRFYFFRNTNNKRSFDVAFLAGTEGNGSNEKIQFNKTSDETSKSAFDKNDSSVNCIFVLNFIITELISFQILFYFPKSFFFRL